MRPAHQRYCLAASELPPCCCQRGKHCFAGLFGCRGRPRLVQVLSWQEKWRLHEGAQPFLVAEYFLVLRLSWGIRLFMTSRAAERGVHSYSRGLRVWHDSSVHCGGRRGSRRPVRCRATLTSMSPLARLSRALVHTAQPDTSTLMATCQSLERAARFVLVFACLGISACMPRPRPLRPKCRLDENQTLDKPHARIVAMHAQRTGCGGRGFMSDVVTEM